MTNQENVNTETGEWIGPEMDESTAQFLDGQPVQDYTPTVPAKVRDAAYFVGLGVTAVGFIVINSAAAVMEDPSAVVVIGGNVVAGFGLIASGLGVAYRPGKTS